MRPWAWAVAFGALSLVGAIALAAKVVVDHPCRATLYLAAGLIATIMGLLSLEAARIMRASEATCEEGRGW